VPGSMKGKNAGVASNGKNHWKNYDSFLPMKNYRLSTGVGPIVCKTCYKKFQTTIGELIKSGDENVDVWKKKLSPYAEVGVGQWTLLTDVKTKEDHASFFVLELYPHDLCKDQDGFRKLIDMELNGIGYHEGPYPEEEIWRDVFNEGIGNGE
jgi:hypothetical protein